MPTVEERAPDFTLPSSLGGEVGLADFRGEKNVVLVFYPKDYSSVCSVQLPEYSNRLEDFEKRDAVVLGVNRFDTDSHKAWAAEFGIGVPLLTDATGAVARTYEVDREEAGAPKRAVFIIDKDGVLRFTHVEKTPGEFTLHADAILEELDRL